MAQGEVEPEEVERDSAAHDGLKKHGRLVIKILFNYRTRIQPLYVSSATGQEKHAGTQV